MPELLLYGGVAVHDRLLLLMEDIWKRGSVVKYWKDTEIVPILQKGDLKKCGNWRGMSLLDVVGKVFVRIMRDRLQVVAEIVLPESQCGFRKGKGCIDMIFVMRQLVEMSRDAATICLSYFMNSITEGICFSGQEGDMERA